MTHDDAVRLKKALWAGALPSKLWRSFKPSMTMGAIYHVRGGLRWADAPWPDGSMGAMPPARAARIARARQEVRIR